MKFRMENVLSPFNKGDLKKGQMIYAADNIKDLRERVIGGKREDMFEFADYSTDEDLPFKSGKFGVNNYRYCYIVNDEEAIIHNTDWMKYI